MFFFFFCCCFFFFPLDLCGSHTSNIKATNITNLVQVIFNAWFGYFLYLDYLQHHITLIILKLYRSYWFHVFLSNTIFKKIFFTNRQDPSSYYHLVSVHLGVRTMKRYNTLPRAPSYVFIWLLSIPTSLSSQSTELKIRHLYPL